jgi:hypothetical protein
MQGLIKNSQRDMDPREALLALASEAKADPMWVNPAYSKTQPREVFQEGQVPHENVRFLD